MHNIADFIDYNADKLTSGEHVVLVWSKKDGYYFIQFGYVFPDGSTKIVGMKK